MKPIARVMFAGAGDVGVAGGRDGPFAGLRTGLQPPRVMMSRDNNEFRIKRIVFLT
jgi:hypothetical protein